MQEVFYLMSGNINPSLDTDKIHLDMLKATNKERPLVYMLATASNSTDWHSEYVKNMEIIFSKYQCDFKIIDDIKQLENDNLENVDIIYFLGGNPYKHTNSINLKNKFKNISIKAGTSAGAIFLGYQTFFLEKDDYLISIPNMLDFVDLHVLPHSEIHKEEIVFNYLINEVNIPVLRLYGQSCLKIQETESGEEVVSAIMGETLNSLEKIEIITNRKFYQSQEDKVFNLDVKLIK